MQERKPLKAPEIKTNLCKEIVKLLRLDTLAKSTWIVVGSGRRVTSI